MSHHVHAATGECGDSGVIASVAPSSLSFRAKSRNPAAKFKGNTAGSFDFAQDDSGILARPTRLGDLAEAIQDFAFSARDGVEHVKRPALREYDMARVGAPDRIFSG